MLKKTLVLCTIYLASSGCWALDYDKLRSDFDNLDENDKSAFKEKLKKLGWLETSVSGEFKGHVNYDYVKTERYGITEAWVKRIVFNDISKDGLGLNDYTMELNHYNCNDRSRKSISYTDYSFKTGKVLNTVTNPNYGVYSKFQAVIPETVGESELDAICLINYIKSN